MRHDTDAAARSLWPGTERPGCRRRQSGRRARSEDQRTQPMEAFDRRVTIGGPEAGLLKDRRDQPQVLKRHMAKGYCRALERRLANGRPTLGGSQLMARALGSRVFAGPRKEIGRGRVTLTDEGAASCLAPLADPNAAVLHRHGDTFDLPESAACFKLPLRKPGVRRRCASFGASVALAGAVDVGHAVELAAAGISVTDLRSATANVADRLRKQARRIFAEWLQQDRSVR